MEMSMYSAVFGALSTEMRLNLSANNLANVNTTGYKRDRVSFEDVFFRYAHDYHVDPRGNLREKELLPRADLIAKPRLAEQTIDFGQGALQATGNPLDLAIQGQGFFKVAAPGGPAYTRNGAFHRNAEGMLVTDQDYPVLGTGGPIQVPEGKAVTVDAAGMIYVDGGQVGQVDLVTVQNLDALQKLGSNLYTAQPGATIQEGIAQPGRTEVAQGYLEKPNVEVVDEMVSMIETQRTYEAYQKVISGSNELDTKAIRMGTDKS
ncbi:MAG: flagellar basal-body rod protein FlgF [Solidesulfovibrio sp.]|jgi:flagellar basal-body rod protein FlgG|uniref:flagellar basal-body rod protein FlgF n=1 Tax=Solidesulfovibrio sp. TaxID=2910990 RepID=UPI002B2162FB|nr:flagellar basal-body rod protein FlgF [Solidesulfovibrio sp.]MEA4857711.1 flagellar basal-body rod protein FlgF [Solidesulfovibrio sp.]